MQLSCNCARFYMQLNMQRSVCFVADLAIGGPTPLGGLDSYSPGNLDRAPDQITEMAK